MSGKLSRRAALALGGSAALALLGGGALLQGCEEEKSAASDRSEVLAAVVDVVILPMIAELRAEIEALPGALDAFVAQPSPETLGAARTRWSSARGAYRLTLAFGIGPSDDIALTGGILDEPTNLANLDALVAKDPPPDLVAVQSSPANARGFLAIEALLFEVGAEPSAIVARYTTAPDAAGRKAALSALGSDLQKKLAAVADGWTTGSFSEQIRTAGNGSTSYKAQRDAFDALLNQTLSIADRVLNILRKSAGVTPDDASSPVADRSDRTLEDLRDDLKGIEALYTEVWAGKSGPSIASVVAEVNGGADASMRGALAGAFEALGAFAPPLRAAAPARQAEVDALLAKLRQVKTALATEVFNALGVSVGISDKDGD